MDENLSFELLIVNDLFIIHLMDYITQKKT